MRLLSGNLKELYQGQAAEADFKWQAQYGNVIRFKALFGVCNDIHTCAIRCLIKLFIGGPIDDFRPCRLAVHLREVGLSISQIAGSQRHFKADQRKRNSVGGRWVLATRLKHEMVYY
jgi:hypothetical protein